MRGHSLRSLSEIPLLVFTPWQNLALQRTVIMANIPKNMVIGSGAVSGLVALLALVDFVTGIPFNKMVILDVTLLLGAAGVLYMCWDSYRDFR